MNRSVVPSVKYAAGMWQLPKPLSLPSSANFAAGRWGTPSMQRQQDSRIHRLAGTTMGTTWSLRLVNEEFAALDPVQALVQSALATVIEQMSNWEPQSVISRFNNASAGSTHQLPAEFVQVLDAAMYWAGRSGGALDPTVGALVALWGFGPREEPLQAHSGKRPHDAVIRSALDGAGFQSITWSPGRRCIDQPGNLKLDLCGIAKGFAVDLVVQHLHEAGWKNGLFEIGGELRGWGCKPDGKPWQIQLGGLSEAEDQPIVVAVKDGSFATSGDYWHHFFADGERYSHTLDPRTGWPIAHDLASVTVHHAECMHADALATVLTVLGPEQGMQFAQEHAVAAVLFRHGSAQPLMSDAWKDRFAP